MPLSLSSLALTMLGCEILGYEALSELNTVDVKQDIEHAMRLDVFNALDCAFVKEVREGAYMPLHWTCISDAPQFEINGRVSHNISGWKANVCIESDGETGNGFNYCVREDIERAGSTRDASRRFTHTRYNEDGAAVGVHTARGMLSGYAAHDLLEWSLAASDYDPEDFRAWRR